MGIDDILLTKKEHILRLAAERGARNVRVFGSVANGSATADSDVDFLVDLDADRTLFDIGGLLMDLQDLLGRKVDVLTEGDLSIHIRDQVLREAVLL